jgi:asparagine synthase (glutamine-hydrolysing)
MLARVRDALTNRFARERGLFHEAYVHRLLEAPNATRSTLGSNVLWQLGLLEMWLQSAAVE